VTVCIAATVLGETIVAISDRRIGLAGFSADHVMDKIDQIHPNWSAMVSAFDVTLAMPIWSRVRSKLGFQNPTVHRPPEKTLAEVAEAFIASFQEERKEQINNTLLVTHGLTVESFLKDGKRRLGLSLFTDLWNKVSDFHLDCEFLVSGFSANGEAHVFGIEDPGVCRNYSSLGFWAIGSGQRQALSSIFFSFKDVGTNPNFESVLYDLCAAKFMAETEPSVGQATNVLVHRFGRKTRMLSDDGVKKLRELWETSGRPRTPSGVVETVKSLNFFESKTY
jgi:hypothetical protein